MIFVTVGTSSWKFDRLLIEMDRIASFLTEEIIMQVGESDFVPKNCKYFKFLPKSEIDRFYDEARVIVSHAGVGSILNSTKRKKSLMNVPRIPEKSEHWDNHQIELAKKLEKEKKFIVVYDIKKLESKIKNIKVKKQSMTNEGELKGSLKDYLDLSEI